MVPVKLRLEKDYNDNESESLMEKIKEKYGSPARLKQRVTRGGCRNPQMVDDFEVYKALKKGYSFKVEKVLQSSRAVSCFTPRRVELLSFLKDNEVKSIKSLANHLGRDYKNVYDDSKALEDAGLIKFEKEGRKQRPRLDADRIVLEFK